MSMDMENQILKRLELIEYAEECGMLDDDGQVLGLPENAPEDMRQEYERYVEEQCQLENKTDPILRY